MTEGQRKALGENRGPGWSYETTADENGRVLEEGWKYTKPPEKFDQNGLAHLQPFIEKLVRSKNWFSSVTALARDGDRLVSLDKMEGEYQIPLMIEWRTEPEREKRARAFFSARGIVPIEDYLAGNGDVVDATRVITWPVKGDAKSLAKLVKQVAVELCGISETEGLDISFEEHPDERGKFAGAGSVTITTTTPRVDPPREKERAR